MRTQKVSVNVWQMMLSSCSYLVLAFVAWIFLRLVQACFWFPSYLHKQEAEASQENKSIDIGAKKIEDLNQENKKEVKKHK